MNIEAFLLCDAATDQQGKLNVLGAFDNIFAEKMPVRYPACSIATRIRFDKSEGSSHSVKMQIIDIDGNKLGPKLEGPLSVKTPPGRNSSVANLILNIQGLELGQYGEYQIDLLIDNEIRASLPLRVSETSL
jgi:hypothetical protein